MCDSLSKGSPNFPALLFGLLFVSLALHAQEFVPSELIIKFKTATPDSIVTQVISTRDLSTILPQRKTLPAQRISPVFPALQRKLTTSTAAQASPNAQGPQVLRIRFADRQTADDAVAQLQGSPYVEYVQRNYIYRLDQLPSDSAAPAQWNLQRIGIFQLWAAGLFDKPLPQVRVGVLDTGVDYLHPDLTQRIATNDGETGLDANGQDKRFNGIDDDGNGYVDDWRGYDFVDQQDPDIGDWSTRDNDPMDENGHGTAVAGIIGAESNNRLGIAGVSPAAQIVPLRAFNASGEGTDADIAAAVVYAADNGVQVLNMSFGDVISSPLLKDVLHYAHEKNVVLVASSGNDGTSFPHYPSDFSDVISVGSVTQNDAKSIFSSYGPSLALMAPGEGISTLKLGGGYQASFSGTSAAAPHVSGIASLLISLDKASRSSKSSAVPITNDEVRADLLAGADDLGDPGWDDNYGAGIVDARILLSPLARNVVMIASPAVDAQISSSLVPVIGTATTDQLTSVALYYGSGSSPSAWQLITQSSGKHFINDTLVVWNVTSLSEGIYTLRLQVKNIQSGDVENRLRVFISRSAPIVLNFTFRDSVIYQDTYCALATLRLDRPMTAVLRYRPHGSQTGFSEISSPGTQLNHSFLLTPKELLPGASYDFYILATDGTGKTIQFPTVALAGTDEFNYTFNSRTIPTTGFTQLALSLPSGFVLNRTDSITGKHIVLLNQYDATGNFGKLKAFQYSNGSFSPVDSTVRSWVPRDLKQAFNDGRLTTLVQDQGVTELLSSDSQGSSYFKTISLAESTDVWGSQLYDFDGDGKLDLIARSSSQYLIYQNLGENKFNLVARLDDPTPPQPGDAANQFGPPRALVGDFSRTGNAEVVFADYDGDVVMYRQVNKQTAPFTFQLVWTDTTDLLETSDFLTAGDFEGNGTLDFAAAGHSNLDLNNDREYDAPTWNVRIFSRRSADPLNTFTKIWDQTFYGVKTGLSYDNGIVSGKILASPRDQLFLSLNPYLYVIDYDAATHTFQPIWMHASSSNSVLISDFDGDGTAEFGFNTGGKVQFFEHASTTAKPQTPWGVSAAPISARAVKVGWSSALPSGNHNVYRDTVPQVHSLLASVSGVSYVDTTVVSGKAYWYAISLLNPTESDRSTPVMTVPHNPALIDSIVKQSVTQISISLTFPPDPNRLQDAVILLDDSLKPTSIALHAPSKYLLSFGAPLAKGNHTLHLIHLVDLYGLEADTSRRFSFETELAKEPTFYLKQASFASSLLLAIDFSDTLSSSGLDLSNYQFSNAVRSFALKDVRLDSVSRTRVYLSLQDNEHLTPVGFRMSLTASDKIQNIKGEFLNDGKGETVSLAVELDNLDQIMVFPDPLKYSVADINRSHITFANVPQYCRIDIFTANGLKITTLQGSTPAAGIQWNLIDDKGKAVGSGIYVFLATQLDQNSNELRRKTGKFAIIR